MKLKYLILIMFQCPVHIICFNISGIPSLWKYLREKLFEIVKLDCTVLTNLKPVEYLTSVSCSINFNNISNTFEIRYINMVHNKSMGTVELHWYH